MSEILVTHADSWVGGKLVDALRRAEGHHVLTVGVPTDLRRMSQLTHVFHLAPEGTATVLEYCQRKLPLLTFVSDYIYGDRRANIIAEDAIRAYSRTVDWPATIVRHTWLYGPGQPIVLDDLETARDYLYIDDYIRALLHTMRPGEGCPIYDAAYGRHYTGAEVAAAVGAELPARPSGTVVRIDDDYVPKPDRIRAQLGWEPRVPLEQGVRTAVPIRPKLLNGFR